MSSRDALHVTCQKNSIQSLFHCSFSKQSVWLKFVWLFDFCCYYRCCIHDEIIIWIGDWSMFQWKFYSMRHMTVVFDESILFFGNDLTLFSYNHFIALQIHLLYFQYFHDFCMIQTSRVRLGELRPCSS